MKTKSLTIFTILTVLTLLAAVCVGCKDKNGVSYSDYPVAGKSYKYVLLPEFYYIYVFADNGICRIDLYEDYKLSSSDVYYWYYWMEGDSIFMDTERARKDKVKKMKYHSSYITYDNDTLMLVQ